MARVFNKMYIVSGGVEATDKLSSYRFQSKTLLNTIPIGYTHTLFDKAIEVDTTGKHIEYDTFHGDNYWTTCDDTQLKDLNCHRVAKINDVWVTLDIDPFEDNVVDYLEGKGYYQKLGEWGSGWYDKDHRPPFKQAIFTRIHQSLKLEWDFKRNRFAGIVPNMKKDELTIYTGERPHSFDDKIGNIKVDGKTVIVKYNDDVFTFEKETDQGFIDFLNLCLKANNQVVFNHAETKWDTPDWQSKRILRETSMKVMKTTLEQLTKNEFEWKQKDFKEIFNAYKEVK